MKLTPSLPLIISFLGLAMLTPAQAVPTSIDAEDIFGCDILFVPDLVDEIGLFGAFPSDEALSSFDTPGGPAPCPVFNGIAAEVTVSITNLSGTDWRDVWYVADPGTTLSNFDGVVSGVASAFKIDAVGVNVPLISESISTDGIWAAGEVWEFVIQDYSNSMGLAASAFGSIGLLSAGDMVSSGSIVAYVPEPSRVLLLGLGLLGLIAQRRRG